MKKRGFTLIELMVVIAIIGLLAAIALPRFANVSDSAKVANVQGNLSSLRTSIAMFHAKADVYPRLDGKEDVLSDVTGEYSNSTADKEGIVFTDYYGKNKLAETPADSGNSITAGNTVKVATRSGNSLTGDEDGGWVYATTTGDIRADLPSNAYGDSISWDEF